MIYSNALPRRVRGHSLYATLAPFPIVCFILVFVTDLAYWATASIIWETASVWLLTIGLIAAVFVMGAGIIDLVRSRTIAGLGQPWLAVAGHAVAICLSVVNVLIHSRDGYTAIVPQGLILSFVVVLVLLASTVLRRRSIAARTRVGVA